MNESTVSKSKDIEIIYEEPLHLLDESVHFNNAELVRELNRLREEINRLNNK